MLFVILSDNPTWRQSESTDILRLINLRKPTKYVGYLNYLDLVTTKLNDNQTANQRTAF